MTLRSYKTLGNDYSASTRAGIRLLEKTKTKEDLNLVYHASTIYRFVPRIKQ
jgi:hypothetical protein